MRDRNRTHLTEPQHRVLRWLLAYPGVHLFCKEGGRLWWSARWQDESWRINMEQVIGNLGGDATDSRPRAAPVAGGTPRCTRGTFRALLRRGLIGQHTLVWYNRHTPTVCYQITKAGVIVLAQLQQVSKEAHTDV